jgi:excisionase family DNA binding protein
VATPPKISLDDLIQHSDRAAGLADDQVRQLLSQIAERTSALNRLEIELSWWMLARRNASISSDGFPSLLNATQLADQLSIPESWVREQARIGRLPSVKLGHYVRFRLDDVKRFISDLTNPVVTNRISANILDTAPPDRKSWPQSNDTTNKTVLVELADAPTTWTTVLWAHAVHENGFFHNKEGG